MSGSFVLQAMTNVRRCPRTGLAIPECSCRACCRRLLRCQALQPPRPAPRLPLTRRTGR